MVEEFFNEPETIVSRLRGIYDTGPEDNPNEFRREFLGRPPINYEAARRIEALEQEVERLKSSIIDLKDDYRREYCGQSVADYLQAWSDSVLNKGEGKG